MIYLLFITHFVSDFLLQSREVATKKSSEFVYLFRHLGIIWVSFFVAGQFYPGTGFYDAAIFSFLFATLNTLIHGIIDWNIWKLYKWSVKSRISKQINRDYVRNEDIAQGLIMNQAKDWRYYEDHWFYATIGLDQLLHALTILGLWEWLK